MISRFLFSRSTDANVNIASKMEDLSSEQLIVPDVNISKFTTLRIGGIAEFYSKPQSREQLVRVIETCRAHGVPYRIMGRGSNLFVTSDHLEGVTIRNVSACDSIEFDGNQVRVGSSVSLQTLLKQAADRGLGGMEYLYSVPGNIGGAIFMNAGRGAIANRNISDHVTEVEVLHEGRIRRFSKRKCQFGYRTSVFQRMVSPVVLSAKLKLNSMEASEAKQLLIDRVQFCKEKQDNTAPNAGSVFRYHYSLADQMRGAKAGQAKFSTKTSNWILNHGDESPTDVQRLIAQAIELHRESGLKEPVVEWTVWDK